MLSTQLLTGVDNIMAKKDVLRKKKYTSGLSAPQYCTDAKSLLCRDFVDNSVSKWHNLCISWDKSVKTEMIHRDVDIFLILYYQKK